MNDQPTTTTYWEKLCNQLSEKLESQGRQFKGLKDLAEKAEAELERLRKESIGELEACQHEACNVANELEAELKSTRAELKRVKSRLEYASKFGSGICSAPRTQRCGWVPS